MRRDAAWRLVEHGRLSSSLQAENDVLREIVQERNKENERLAQAMELHRQAAMAAMDNNAKLKGWATVGKVGTIALGVGAAAGITMLILSR